MPMTLLYTCAKRPNICKANHYGNDYTVAITYRLIRLLNLKFLGDCPPKRNNSISRFTKCPKKWWNMLTTWWKQWIWNSFSMDAAKIFTHAMILSYMLGAAINPQESLCKQTKIMGKSQFNVIIAGYRRNINKLSFRNLPSDWRFMFVYNPWQIN